MPRKINNLNDLEMGQLRFIEVHLYKIFSPLNATFTKGDLYHVER